MKIGDRVMYSKEFLRSTSQYTGSICFVRGEVVEVGIGKPAIVTVKWDSFTPCYVDDEGWIGTTSKVLDCNLEPDPFLPPEEKRMNKTATIKVKLDGKVLRELELEQQYEAVKPEVHRSVIKTILEQIKAKNPYVIISFNE